MTWKVTPTNLLPDDADAVAYIAAVEAADGEALEPAVRLAINSFVKGCKADGIWPAIKASCILAGARTLNGALVPLVGAAPTNYNFVAGDYNRKTGLVGDGSTKYLNSNRNNNADPQDSQHVSAYCTQVNAPSVNGILLGSDPVAGLGSTSMYINSSKTFFSTSRSSGGAANNSSVVLQAGLAGVSRASSARYTWRINSASTSVTQASSAPTSTSIFVFDRGPTPPHYPSNSRLAFYSIGEALDLALLDTRVTALVNALGTAIL